MINKLCSSKNTINSDMKYLECLKFGVPRILQLLITNYIVYSLQQATMNRFGINCEFIMFCW